MAGRTVDALLDAAEARTQELGRELLAVSRSYRGGPAERLQDWLLTNAMLNERFRVSALRYLDVLASLDHDHAGREAKRLAREYFGSDFPGLPAGLRWLLRIARNERLPARVVGEAARRSATLFAGRFITAPGSEAVGDAIVDLARHGRRPSFDLLGEAVLSEREAESHRDRYLTLIGELAGHPAARLRTDGDVAALQVSLKLSSLTSHFSPVDPEGTLGRVRPRLEAICRAAAEAGAGVIIDAEQYEFRDLTWEIFRRVFASGEALGSWPDAGLVVQAYLRDSAAHATDVIAFARRRRVPFQVRLVKGAYWDFETIEASAQQWPAPVFERKAATDRNFERMLATMLEAGTAFRLAVGSHNVRAHALAEALAEQLGLPAGAVEHQTLYRTAEGLSRAIGDRGWAARDYVPVGELLPAMAYLVRRILENSSQAGFLLQSRSGASAGELLRRPEADESGLPAAPDLATPAGFRRMPAGRWFDAGFRDRFEAALRETRDAWGERLVPSVDVEDLEWRAIHSPSHPGGEPVGSVAFAGAAAVEQAVTVARSGAATWSATPPAKRAQILRDAAGLLEERAMEFAARVVHEGGRDRQGAYAEVEEAVDFLRYYAMRAELLFERFGEQIAPRGVVAVIPPWNFSLAIPCGMTAAALACGNAAILKPAEQTPLIAGHLVALLHEAGVPRETLVYLPGTGEAVGSALAGHPGVAMVAFTGSRAVGTALHEQVLSVPPEDGEVRALVAEMGGKNAAIVFVDADLDEAVAEVIASAFGHANQKCSAVSRVLVEAPIVDRFSERLVDAARSLALGPADQPGTQVNPLIDDAAAQRLEREAAAARGEGEVLLDRFGAAAGLVRGPLIVRLPSGRSAAARTMSEELFGPILAVMPFESHEQAYRIANETAYGLTAAIYSRSPATVEEATRAIEAGNIYVNRGTTGARPGVEPFGGMRMSGTGPKAGGPDYLWAFCRRTDLPPDERGDDAPARGAASAPEPFAVQRWLAPFEARAEAIEGAAVLLGPAEPGLARSLFYAAQAARRELGRPAPTIEVAGQHTELRYDTPRGPGLMRLRGDDAAWWLAAALLAGNPVLLIDSPDLEPLVNTLHRAGVPAAVLRSRPNGTVSDLLRGAAAPDLAFVATDAGPALNRRALAALAVAAPGQRSLKTLLSPLDGPQPGEPGFLQRFAWPRVVAERTLRHGADLALPAAARRRR